MTYFKMFSLLVLTSVFVLTSCSSKKGDEKNAEDNAEAASVTASDVAGLYTGVLPCASCPGISYRILLNEDMTYQERMVYQGEAGEPIETSGRYKFGSGGVIELDKSGDSGFKFLKKHPDGMLMLDKNGNEVAGSTASQYVLKNPVRN